MTNAMAERRNCVEERCGREDSNGSAYADNNRLCWLESLKYIMTQLSK